MVKYEIFEGKKEEEEDFLIPTNLIRIFLTLEKMKEIIEGGRGAFLTLFSP